MCSVTPSSCITLPTDATAAGQARRFLASATCQTHHATVMDDALLLVSEIVGNAVRHGAPPVTAAVECVEQDVLQVRVTDGSPYPPRKRDADLLDDGGRGMTLVDLLSDDWGVDQDADGKTVWFRLGAAA